MMQWTRNIKFWRHAFIAIGIVYCFSPLIVIEPVEGYEARLIWETLQGVLYTGGMGQRRAFLQKVLIYFAEATHIQPWTIWQASIAILAGPAFYFTYRFIKHFRPLGLGSFTLLALAVPFWLITIQWPSDTTLAYPAVAAAFFLVTRRHPAALVAAAVMLALACRARMDAFPLTIVAVLILWVDRQNFRRWFIDCWILGLSFLAVVQAMASYEHTTLWAVVIAAMAEVGGIDSTDWMFDVLSKVINYNFFIALPFALFAAWKRRAEPQEVQRRLLWIIPILLYIYLWRHLFASPRHFIYIAPFVMLITYDGYVALVEILKAHIPFTRRPWVIPTAVAVVLFNPMAEVIFREGNSENPAEQLHHNSEKMLNGRFHTGLLPAFNTLYRLQYKSCFNYMDATIDGFLASSYPNLVIFALGNDTENTTHQRVLQHFYSHFGIPFGVDTYGSKLPFTVDDRAFRMAPDVELRTVTVSYNGKSIILLKTTGAHHSDRTIYLRENELFSKYLEVTGLVYKPEDYYKFLGYNLITSYYPAWLEKSGHCRIRDPNNIQDWGLGGLISLAKTIGPTPAPSFMDIRENVIKHPPRRLEPPSDRASKSAALDSWLRTIPDYDVRLQERADRAVQSLRLIHGLLTAIAIATAAGVAILYRWGRRLLVDILVANGSVRDPGPDLIDRLRLALARQRQKRIRARIAKLARSGISTDDLVVEVDSIDRVLSHIERPQS